MSGVPAVSSGGASGVAKTVICTLRSLGSATTAAMRSISTPDLDVWG